MTLSEALKETGKARRPIWGKDFCVIDGDNFKLSVAEALATDYEPYHDPPKERRLRRIVDASCDQMRLARWCSGAHEHPNREFVEASPERDQIVEAAVALKRSLGGSQRTVYPEIDALAVAVEEWEKSGRPR